MSWDDGDPTPRLRRRAWVLVMVAAVAAVLMLALLAWATVEVIGGLRQQDRQLEEPT